MIDPEVFHTSRELARAKLPPDEAASSFGYWIDIPNAWESADGPERLIHALGIHYTHARWTPEIVDALGMLSRAEFQRARKHVRLCQAVTDLLSTIGRRQDLSYDLAETLADWRVIESFQSPPCRVLDYGAGCARQGSFLQHPYPESIYVATDATLQAYTVQNLMLTCMGLLGAPGRFFDLLDFEKAAVEMPDLADAEPGDRYHLPAWMAEQRLPQRYFDVVLACHVHNELSGPDCRRMLRCVDRSMADDGVFYIRSELNVGPTKDYMDAVDLHGMDMLAALREMDIDPIWSRIYGAFQTTLFARRDSAPWRWARDSGDPDCAVLDLQTPEDLARHVGALFIHRQVTRLGTNRPRTVYVRCGEPFDRELTLRLVDPAFELPESVARAEGIEPVEPLRDALVIEDAEFFGPEAEGVLRRIADFEPEAIFVASYRCAEIEQRIRAALPPESIRLRLGYPFYPVAFLHALPPGPTDPLFDGPVLTVDDVDRAAEADRPEGFAPLLGDRATAPTLRPEGVPA